MIQDLTLQGDDIPYVLGLSYPVYNSQNVYLNDETLINGNLNQSAEKLHKQVVLIDIRLQVRLNLQKVYL
jgi:hypothetical protein